MIKILTALKSKGVFLSLDATGQNISIRGNIRNLTEEDKNGIKSSKSEIIGFLKEQKQSTQHIPAGTRTGDIIDLSPNQESIWVYERIEGPGSAYIIPGIYEFEMPGFDQQKFYHAVNLLVQQTDVLRTIFIEENDKPRQQILESVDVKQHVTIYEVKPSADTNKEVQAEIDRRYAIPFDIAAKTPLWEIVLFRLPESQFRFFLKIHHLVADGESLNLIIRKTLEIYSGTETINPQSEGSLQYSDFTNWINNREHLSASSSFWKKEMAGYEDDFQLPYDFKDSAKRNFEGKELHYLFPAENSARLIAYASEHKISIASIFTGASSIVLSKWARKNDLVVGTPAAGRNHPQLWSTIGNFVNTLPLRVPINYEVSPLEYLNSIQQKYHTILDHQLYPFSYILKDIEYQYKEDEFPLFNVMISVPNNQRIDSFEEKISINRKASLYDITFTFMEAKGDFKIITEYNASKFEEATIYDITSQVEMVLGAFFDNKIKALSEVKLLTPAQEEYIKETYCKSDWPVKADEQHIVELFRKNLVRYADKTVVVQGDESLTYAEFGEQAAKLGTYLIEKGLKRGDRVCVVLPKSINQFTALWAIWTAGATYVPVDYDTPRDRIDAILEDCNPQMVITKEFMKTYDSLENHTADAGYYDQQPPSPEITSYIVFTSGSTGKPKGVMLSHANLIIKLYEFNHALKNDEHTTSITLTSLAFDVSMLEVAMPVTTGGKVVIADELFSFEYNTLIKYIKDNNVTILQGTPTYFGVFMKDLVRTTNEWLPLNELLKHICIGGESLNASLVKRFAEWIPNVSINNHCGPTETCIDVIAAYGVSSFEKNILGKPIGNTEAYVVDEFGNLLPANMIGEMVVGGPSVGQGYWNNDALTKERFKMSPLSKGMVYYSGDIVRRTRDGHIEYIGRKDHQVKLRGYRVELEEINKHILNIKGVLNSYTGIHNNLLVSWVVLDKKLLYEAKTTLTEKMITDALSEKLPSYMVPTAMEFIAALPMTANGKLDIPKLPSPEKNVKIITPPENETQAILQKIVQDVLDIPEVGINDNFFELGGHSLHLVRIANQANQTFNANLKIKDLFINNTIKMLSKLVETGGVQSDRKIIIPRVEFTDNFAPLSHTQKRLWLTTQVGGNVSLNMPAVFNIQGDFDFESFSKSVWDIAERQESVRTLIRENSEGEVCQYVCDMDEFRQLMKVPYYLEYEGKDDEITAITSKLGLQPFDLATGPLTIINVYKVSPKVHAVYMCQHHLIGDGWSIQLLFGELIKNYNAYVFTGKAHNFEPLPFRYRDYAYWVRQNIDKLFSDEQSYWMQKFKKPIPQYKFPFEKFRPARRTFDGGGFLLWVPDVTAKKINDYVAKHNTTAFAVCLAIFKALLYKYTGVTDHVSGTPISGRFSVETENLLGLFLNTLPIRSEFSEDDSFADIIANEGRELKDSYDNQFFQMDEIVRRHEIKTPTGHTPLFDTMFMFQNFNSIGLTKDSDNSTDLNLGRRNSSGVNPQFDIVLAWVQVEEKMELGVAFNTNSYEEQHIRLMCLDTFYLVEKALSDPSVRVKDFFDNCEYQFLTDKPIQFLNPVVEMPVGNDVDLAAETIAINESGNLEAKNTLREILQKFVDGDMRFDEDYFARGGNSLGAIQSVNEINEAFGTEFSILEFYTNPSVNQLYALIYPDGDEATAGKEESTDSNMLIKLNEFEAGRPEFFMLPPIIGSGIVFKPLATAVSSQFNVYGVNTPVLDVESDHIIPELTRAFYNEISAKIESTGTVYLAGYSAGVNLAYEVTKMLEAEGKEVVLFLVDRGPQKDTQAELTDEMVQQITDQHMPLIQQVSVKGDEALIKARIAMILKGLSTAAYEVRDTVKAPVYAFECNGNGFDGYMKDWANFTQSAFENNTLEGNHYEALSPQNVTRISELIKKVYNEKSSVH
jgi:amino acid adenylation domain-containing protein